MNLDVLFKGNLRGCDAHANLVGSLVASRHKVIIIKYFYNVHNVKILIANLIRYINVHQCTIALICSIRSVFNLNVKVKCKYLE